MPITGPRTDRPSFQIYIIQRLLDCFILDHTSLAGLSRRRTALLKDVGNNIDFGFGGGKVHQHVVGTGAGYSTRNPDGIQFPLV